MNINELPDDLKKSLILALAKLEDQKPPGLRGSIALHISVEHSFLGVGYEDINHSSTLVYGTDPVECAGRVIAEVTAPKRLLEQREKLAKQIAKLKAELDLLPEPEPEPVEATVTNEPQPATV